MALAGLTLLVGLAQAAPEVLEVRELAPGVTELTAQPWSANSLVVAMDDGTLVLVDTPPTPAQTRWVLDWMHRTYGERSVVAVNSHHHLDATGGNQVLAEASIPIYAADRTVAEMAARGPAMRAELARTFADDPFMGAELAALRPTPPDHTFPIEGTFTLELGTQHLVLFSPGPAHSADNVVAWFPERRVLYGGCAVKGGDDLGYLGEADLEHWDAALDRLVALDPAIVVPGHGPRSDPELLANTRRLVARERARAAVGSDG